MDQTHVAISGSSTALHADDHDTSRIRGLDSGGSELSEVQQDSTRSNRVPLIRLGTQQKVASDMLRPHEQIEDTPVTAPAQPVHDQGASAPTSLHAAKQETGLDTSRLKVEHDAASPS
jgi:hypothetical protein